MRKKVICSTPESRAEVPKQEPMLGRGVGVGGQYGLLDDHQMPAAESVYPPGEDPETLAKLRKAGFKIQVKGGGMTGHLKQ